MKKIVLILVLILSSLDMGNVLAATDYDHNELLDYPGYGEAMYESIVEQTTFISGRYTENKDYVNESINKITDYAKGWWNEYERISNMPPKEKIREMVNASGGYLLTVGDFIKKIFSDGEESEIINPPSEINPLDYYYIKESGKNSFSILPGYGISYLHNDYSRYSIAGSLTASSSLRSNRNYNVTIAMGGSQQILADVSPDKRNEIINDYNFYISSTGIGAMDKLLSHADKLAYRIIEIQSLNPVDRISNRDNNFKTINNFLKDNPINIATPQPKAYLSCPDGTRINMSINGGTFLDVNGQVMQVSKDGTATVSSQICNLGWEKPTVGYIPGTDQVGITTPDGKTIDAETGERITEDGEIDDELEDGCGTLCAIGKMLKGLGDIAKSIAGLAVKILDGLLGLFVPDNLDFLTEEFKRVTAALQEKISITEDLKSSIKGLFVDGGSNPLNELVIDLPAMSGPISLNNFTFLDTGVPILRRIIGAIFSLYTIFYVYRKIVGKGGIMEK